VDNGQSFYLLSHDNDMDPFYVHGTVLIGLGLGLELGLGYFARLRTIHGIMKH
jgi:hypothetical protein